MKNLLILLIVVAAAFQLWDKLPGSAPPKFDGPYISIYGRASCGFTERMRADLDSAGIRYHYFNVDDKAVAEDLHIRMEAARISTRRYNLPVVDVSGDIFVRPKSQEILQTYPR